MFTGVSGSGKSSLAFGTIAAESQRLIKESYPAFIQSLLPRYGQPDVDSLDNLTAAIVVDQQPMGGNARSTVGTATDAHTLLRLIYSRVGKPAAGGPKAFSFNDPQGMCPGCEGLGQASNIDLDALLDRSKSLNEGAILFPAFAPDTTNWNIFISSGFFDNDKPLKKYTEDELDKLLNLKDVKVKTTAGGKAWNMSYEGLLPRFKRLYVSKGVAQLKPYLREAFEKVVRTGPCSDCGGTRLGKEALDCRIDGVNIAECTAMEVWALADFVKSIDEFTVAPVTAALAAKLENLVHIGLGYLSLD
ncbi:excinuclease ABC subunit UvrA, partial [Saccharothrix longispora]|nr:excinuclease ABC subunit UvrA [Saccharothrix longispora]